MTIVFLWLAALVLLAAYPVSEWIRNKRTLYPALHPKSKPAMVMSVVGLIILGGLLTGCANNTPPPEPRIVVQEVKVPTPVPCPALEELGPEPAYPDTDEAIVAAPNIYERSKLFAVGRLMRAQRLALYVAAKASCVR